MAVDVDRDDMGDSWESEVGLDVGRDDSGEDPDADGRTNLEEWQDNTDPLTLDGGVRTCSCSAAAPAGHHGVLGLLAGLVWLGRRRRIC